MRWTIGPTSNLGKKILKESIRSAQTIWGDKFDYMVLFNGIDRPDVGNVSYYEQSWGEIKLNTQKYSHTREWDTSKNFGSLWKICPPRIRKKNYEIIVDNDVVFKKDVLKTFLKEDKTLFTKSKIRWYGCYDFLHAPQEIYSSGVIGIPPMFDFEEKIKGIFDTYPPDKEWLSYADEQGLILGAIKSKEHIVLDSQELLHDDDYVRNSNGVIHFLQANRTDYHKGWDGYERKNIKL